MSENNSNNKNNDNNDDNGKDDGKEKSKNDHKDLEDEISSIKEEMSELKDLLKNKESKEKHSSAQGINVGGPGTSGQRRSHSRRSQRGPQDFDMDPDIDVDLDFDDEDFDEVGDTISAYLNSVFEGVASNLKHSMEQMSQGFVINTDEMEKFERKAHKFEEKAKSMEEKAKHAARKAERKIAKKIKTPSVKFQPLSEDELEAFYEKAPEIVSALADSRRLQILKALEKSAKYQGELSELTGLKGGSFKHHIDSLMNVGFVYQEQARGRYLIKQLGIEALKLAEMLFRRFTFDTEETVEVKDHEDQSEAETEDDAMSEKINKEKENVDDILDEEPQNGEEN